MFTQFFDMHSGGHRKTNWDKIFVEAPEKEAIEFFMEVFDENPYDVACQCCGTNFSVYEVDECQVGHGILVITKEMFSRDWRFVKESIHRSWRWA